MKIQTHQQLPKPRKSNKTPIKYQGNNRIIMQIQQTFWQQKLSPKQLIIDWDKFISLFQQFILQSVSIKLNSLQKQYIKSLIDPENKNLVYKNSYLIFVKEFWDLPSNRTKVLKGQINLSKLPKLKFLSDLNAQQSCLIKISYIPTVDQQEILSKENSKIIKRKDICSEKIYQWRNNKIYMLDKKLEVVSQNAINNQGFLTIGNHQKNDISFEDCQFLNPFHFKFIKIITKKPKQKKPLYMLSDDNQQKNEQQISWYLRDISKSNRLEYILRNQFTYVVMKPSLVIKIGMINQFQIHIIQATPFDIGQNHKKQLNTLLNSDRINYLGQIDPQVPQKHIIDIPTSTVKASDIQYWYNKGYKYEQPPVAQIKKRIDEIAKQQNDIPLKFILVNTITQQRKNYTFNATQVCIGKHKKNQVVINKVTIRNVECQFVCITGIWLLKNVAENCGRDIFSKKTAINAQRQRDSSGLNQEYKKIKIRQLSVGLSTHSFVDNLQCSNRILLNKQAQHCIKGKNISLKISFPKNSSNR